MGWTERRAAVVNQDVHEARATEAGPTVLVLPKPGMQRKLIALCARYGANDQVFAVGADAAPERTPAGIAHFLEHQLFDQPDRNILQKLSAIGASPNAYTGSYYTVYHASVVERLPEALDVVLDFVQSPAFTEATVAKERGIIEQEIRGYRDTPPARLHEETMRALYHEHPLRQPVLGTVEDLQRIDADTLHACHRAFYHPSNLLLVVIGDVDRDAVLEQVAADVAARGYAARHTLRRSYPQEPPEVRRADARVHIPGPRRYCSFALKLPPPVPGEPGVDGGRAGDRQRLVAALDLAVEALVGPTTPLYRRLYDAGVVTEAFRYGLEVQPGVAFIAMGGQSDQPRRFVEAFRDALLAVSERGVDAEEFERARRRALGGYLAVHDSPGALNGWVVRSRFLGFDPFAQAAALREARVEEARDYLTAHAGEETVAAVVSEPGGNDD